MSLSERCVALTLDIDWVPDFVIDFVAGLLLDYGVRATWYVTHDSAATKRLSQHPDLFELGIHPNFLLGSSHGSNPEDVLFHCMKLVPDAISMRTHSLVQSTPLLDTVARSTPVRIDTSLFLPHAPFLVPVDYPLPNGSLTRIPYFWEDDLEMYRAKPCWSPVTLIENSGGLKVFDFHPIHVFLNSPDMQPYTRLKRQVSNLAQADPELVMQFVASGSGSRSAFLEVLRFASAHNNNWIIRDLATVR